MPAVHYHRSLPVGWLGLNLGSVAHRLLQVAPCPILVVPNTDR
jgi:nucleotide-binding universal stress UspA family protein